MVGNMQTSAKTAIESIKQFWHDEEGATAVEYALMASLIAMAIITIVSTLGGTLKNIFTNVNTSITKTQAH